LLFRSGERTAASTAMVDNEGTILVEFWSTALFTNEINRALLGCEVAAANGLGL
jgi:hypothetical protein